MFAMFLYLDVNGYFNKKYFPLTSDPFTKQNGSWQPSVAKTSGYYDVKDPKELNKESENDPILLKKEAEKEVGLKPWRQTSKKFSEFFGLVDKSLVRPHEKERFKQMLNDEYLLESAREVLVQEVDDRILNWTKERERLDAVLYITIVLSGKYQSKLVEDALDVAKKVILKDSATDGQSLDLKRSLMGDRIELGITLLLNQKETWLDIKESLFEIGQNELIAYIENLAATRKKLHRKQLHMLLGTLGE